MQSHRYGPWFPRNSACVGASAFGIPDKFNVPLTDSSVKPGLPGSRGGAISSAAQAAVPGNPYASPDYDIGLAALQGQLIEIDHKYNHFDFREGIVKNGLLDPATRRAITAFQIAARLLPTGKNEPGLLDVASRYLVTGKWPWEERPDKPVRQPYTGPGLPPATVRSIQLQLQAAKAAGNVAETTRLTRILSEAVGMDTSAAPPGGTTSPPAIALREQLSSLRVSLAAAEKRPGGAQSLVSKSLRSHIAQIEDALTAAAAQDALNVAATGTRTTGAPGEVPPAAPAPLSTGQQIFRVLALTAPAWGVFLYTRFVK